jgi:uncharacterized membrane protein
MRTHPDKLHEPVTLGQHAADKVAQLVGSWPFIIGQSIILAAWIFWNAYFAVQYFDGYAFDPAPFILMNLFLSLQAAYTGPLVMISQRRQDEKAHNEAHEDYEVDRHVAQMLEGLHRKVDRIEQQTIPYTVACQGEAAPPSESSDPDKFIKSLKEYGF